MDPRIVVVGTAGHVDHGKSTLVRALTGTDPDRLREEKARGLTIELGFAWSALPSGRLLSLVDVPGHEDFIRNMLAGVGGVDAAILVIAADEGPMPQTLEHLAILDLVGIRQSVIAVTKADLVEPDWLELVCEEASALVEGTSLEGAKVVPVSAEKGTGIDALVAELESLLAQAPPARDVGRPRLSVDRSFSLDGFGTVVTGTLRDGELSVGETIALLPSGRQARVRGMHAYGKAIQTARPGIRTAINLTGIDADQIERGALLARPDDFRPSQIIDVWLEVIEDAPVVVEHDLAAQVFYNAAEIPAFVRVIGQRELAQGAEGPAQLRLAEPVPFVAGDRFVLRLPSPARTIGGGTVLDPHPRGRRRRFHPEVVERFEALATRDPEAIAWQMLREREPCAAASLRPPETGLEPEARDAALASLAAQGRALRLGDQHWMTDRGWAALRARAEAVLRDYHRRFPLRVGPPLEQLREQIGQETEDFAAILAGATREGWLIREGSQARLPEHQVDFSDAQQAAVDALLARFQADPVKTPSVKEAQDAVGASVLEALVARGDLVQASGEVLFDREGFAMIRERILEHIDREGQITVGDLRDLFATSRKYSLAILEYLDRIRVTRRVGDARLRLQVGGAEEAEDAGSITAEDAAP